MRKLIIFLICVLLLIIDNTLMPFFAINEFYPSLLFSFMIFYCINSDVWDGIWIAVFVGLLQDLYLGNVIGINPLINVLLSLIAVKIGENIFKEKFIIPVLTVFFLSVLKGVTVFAVLYLLNIKSIFNAVLYRSLYSMIASVFIYKIVYRLLQKPYMKKEWKF